MLNEQVKRLFNRYGEILVDEYREQLIKDDTNASGQAVKSLSFKSNSRSLTIFGKSYILQIDTGTRPSDYKKGFPSPKALERWIKAKGITSNKYPKTKDLAFAISRRIVLPKLGDRGGTILRFGGGTNLLEFVFNKYRTPLSNDLGKILEKEITLEMEKLFNNANNKN